MPTPIYTHPHILSRPEFAMNKYLDWYISIVNNAKSEDRKKGCGVYYEEHHILPKSVYPQHVKHQWNLVLLTPKEHFILHRLLVKFMVCPDGRNKMHRAIAAMMRTNQKEKRNLSSYQYEICRKTASKVMKEKWETDQNFVESMMGKNHSGFIGFYHTPEGRYTSSTQHPELSPRIIQNWCKNYTGFISKESYNASQYLQSRYSYDDIVGKLTYKEIGFWFEKTTTKNGPVLDETPMKKYDSLKEKLIHKHGFINLKTGSYNPNCMRKSWFERNEMKDEFDEIMNATDEVKDRSVAERIRIFFHLPIHHCPECGNPTKVKNNIGWQHHCSKKCANSSLEKRKNGSATFKSKSDSEKKKINKKREKTFRSKYGVSRNAERSDVREKINTSILNHYHGDVSKYADTLQNKDWLKEQYRIKTTNEIADDLGCSRSLVLKFLKIHSIEMNYSQLSREVQSILYDSDEWLRKKSIDDGMTLSEIANELKTSAQSIASALKFHGLDEEKYESKKTYEFLANNPQWLENQYNVLKKTSEEIANELGVSKSTVLNYMKLHGISRRQFRLTSSFESMIFDFIRNDLNIQNVIQSERNILGNGYEIDIYLPDHDLGIEVNGLYWHSLKDKNYHLKKVEIANEKGINLVHFTDKQIMEKKEIVFSMVRNLLKMNERKIHARKCVIESELKNSTVRNFLESNHVQGHCGSSVRYGLYSEGRLVSVMTFGKPRFNGQYDWELLRFCNEQGTSVIGGFSKLLSHFKKNHPNQSMISYADYQRSRGNVYEQCGFKLLKRTDPGYVWTDGRIVYPRYKTQKHKLKFLLGEDNFDESLTEKENMMRNGFNQYWDCGQLVYCINT